MQTKTCFTASAILAIARLSVAQDFHPEIPKAWDDKEVAHFEMPLAQRDRSPRYMTAKEYYALKVRPVYRWYPRYPAGREPAGYLESLKQKEPEIIFDASRLRTKEDWIQAGKLVFESDTLFRPVPATTPPPNGRAAGSGRGESANGLASDGSFSGLFPGRRYYVRNKGVLEVGSNSCAECHTRVMPDDSLLEGAQGNAAPMGAALNNRGRGGFEEVRPREATPEVLSGLRESAWIAFGAPWIMSKEAFQESLTVDELVRELAAARLHVFARQGTSPSHPPHIPSLIGIQDLKYLDATGLVKHRSIGDLMRYAIINEGLDTLAFFGDFQPSPHQTALSGEEGTRYSDEQLYALALYIYSIKPPANPNQFDDRARRGQRIFEQQGCGGCHTPPFYTNNKLTPAPGFKVPEDLLKSEEILNVSVGTDSTLALQTRRGTGFYKVPSLRGVWYRTAFGHGGQAETLEEWFDPSRLSQDYVPTGFHLGPGAIKGHEFGLNLSPDDRQDLIAFLRTL